MPKTQHWQWYVEEFAPTEQHHHAIDELYFSGRSEFQQVAVLRSPVFGKMLVFDGDTQSAQADERIYHEALVHPALAGRRRPPRGADPRRRRGRDAARGAALPRRRRAARWSISTRSWSSSRRSICPSGRPARSTIRARASSSATRCEFMRDERRPLRRHPLRSHRAAGGLAEQPALQRRRLRADQIAARRRRHLRASGEHRGACHNAALHCKMARTLRRHYEHVVSFFTHVPAFDTDWAFLACSDRVDLAAPRSGAHRRLLRVACAARAFSTTRSPTGGSSRCRSICGGCWPPAGIRFSRTEKPTGEHHGDRLFARPARLGEGEEQLRRCCSI